MHRCQTQNVVRVASKHRLGHLRSVCVCVCVCVCEHEGVSVNVACKHEGVAKVKRGRVWCPRRTARDTRDGSMCCTRTAREVSKDPSSHHVACSAVCTLCTRRAGISFCFLDQRCVEVCARLYPVLSRLFLPTLLLRFVSLHSSGELNELVGSSSTSSRKWCGAT
jgi:hypothetical protein